MYNYPHFTPSDYDFSKFEGPRPGERAVDFTAIDLEGNKRKLSDFFGQWVVLETGSVTCPIYTSKIKTMNQLTGAYPDVTWLLLYVREAHPGENIPQHNVFEEKLACARRARDEDQETRTILVDDLAGTAHRAYGSMPNSVYVINPAGKIVFRGDWNDARAVRRVLKERNPEKIYDKERYSARPNFSGGRGGMLGALRRAGRQAVWDFIKAAPVMVGKHIKKLFVRHG